MFKTLLNKLLRFRKTDLFKTSIGNGIATVIKLFTGLISNKIVAVYLGPAGIALLAQFQNIVEISTYFSSLGINNGITKYVAEYYENEEARNQTISTGFFITIIGTILTSVVIFFGRYYFSDHLLHTREYLFVFVILALSMFLLTLNTFIISVLNGFKQFKIIIIRNILAALISVLLTIILVIKWDLKGALISVILSQVIIFFIIIGIIKRSKWLKPDIILKHINGISIVNLAKFSLMALSTIAFVFVQLQIRNHIIKHISVNDAGQWQAVIRISSIYLMVITNTLIIYFLPRFSEISDKISLRNEILKGYMFVLPLTIFAGLMIFIFKAFIVRLLFSDEFLPMLPLFKFQITGDILKISAWILSMTLMAKAMTKIYVITDLIFSAIYYFLSVIFIRNYGIIGATYAYSIHYLLYLLVMLYIFRDMLFLNKKP